ncbi:hypothetical protein C8A05DRAFT_39531 [Staphylotrichum tortipilum]|uniref:Uncharacterized protein n=1 Tax=Staphylotrichum tortipilum TaxID=2831512 RepID=A0AAN6MB89_9PEZI|nr:hypothetical protein C8A05DRAFT_39531 [Staphylotrichum longicolle]
MKNLSRSLAPTDFYRLAPKGRHVSAWATGGINKIIQSVNPTTREPQGQYFIFFDSLDAAHRYRDEITSLLAPPKAPRESAEAPYDRAPPLSLLPPGAHLEYALYPVPTQPKALGLTTELTATQGKTPYLLTPHLADPDLEFGPTKRVILRLAGSRLTPPAMRAALDADAEARNMPWSLVCPDRPWSAVRGLRAGSALIKYGMCARAQTGERPEEQREEEEEDQEEEEGEEENEGEGEGKEKDGWVQNQAPDTGYSRFVLTFTEPGEALRFVRAWHHREMVDERTNRTIVFHAAALW